MNKKYYNNIKPIAEIAIMLSLTLVLEIISRIILPLPQGGSINLGYSVIFFFAFRRGLWAGLVLTTLNGLLLVLFYSAPIIGVWQFGLDYLMGFWVCPLVVALVGWTFKAQTMNRYKIIIAVILGIFLSFSISTLSGYLYFFPLQNPEARFLNSIIYNSIYSGPTLIITLIIVIYLSYKKNIANW